MSETVRIFQEMRDSDALRADMKESIKARALEHLNRDSFGALQQSGIKGALDDIYRRVFENGWFGKDIFDGRFQSDTKDRDSSQNFGGQYDQRAAFYGLDKPQEQEQRQDHDCSRDDDLER